MDAENPTLLHVSVGENVKIEHKIIKRVTEELKSGKTDRISDIVDKIASIDEVRRGGYYLYNSSLGKSKRSNGDASVYQGQLQDNNTERINGKSNGVSRNGGNDVKFSASGNENYTKESLTEPVTKIVKDLEKVKLRAELRNGKKVYRTKDAKIVLDSIMNNLTFRENHIFFGKKAYETNAKRLIFDYQFFLRIRFLVFVEYVV